MWLRHGLVGALTYVPGFNYILDKRKRRMKARNRGDAKKSAPLALENWFRFINGLYNAGMPVSPLTNVAELGPGDSFGLGFAALLGGAKTYVGLDTIKYAESTKNLALFDEMVDVIANDFRGCDLKWLDEEYHSQLDVFKKVVSNAQIVQQIRQAIPVAIDGNGHSDTIRYIAPWEPSCNDFASSIDLVVSNAVLEHVNDLEGTYSRLAVLLKPGGWMSHLIDFSSHGLATEWNGHWRLGNFAWKLVSGRRPFLINRQPYSVHEKLIRQNRFEIASCVRRESTSSLLRSQLSPEWRSINDEDLICHTAIVYARKAQSQL